MVAVAEMALEPLPDGRKAQEENQQDADKNEAKDGEKKQSS